MWDAMLDYEVRRRELVRQFEYARLVHEASAGSTWSRRARRRASAVLRAVAARLSGPATASGGSAWVPLLEELCR